MLGKARGSGWQGASMRWLSGTHGLQWRFGWSIDVHEPQATGPILSHWNRFVRREELRCRQASSLHQGGQFPRMDGRSGASQHSDLIKHNRIGKMNTQIFNGMKTIKADRKNTRRLSAKITMNKRKFSVKKVSTE